MTVKCRACLAIRVKAWEETRAQNGLIEAEWPKPKAPEFKDAGALEEHVKRVHRAAA